MRKTRCRLCGIYIFLKIHRTYSSIHKGFLRSPPLVGVKTREAQMHYKSVPLECVTIPSLCPLPHTS